MKSEVAVLCNKARTETACCVINRCFSPFHVQLQYFYNYRRISGIFSVTVDCLLHFFISSDCSSVSHLKGHFDDAKSCGDDALLAFVLCLAPILCTPYEYSFLCCITEQQQKPKEKRFLMISACFRVTSIYLPQIECGKMCFSTR